MITVPAGIRVLVATKPVDFRKGGDGLAAVVREALGEDPFSETIFVFRSKRADRLKNLAWDGSGLVLFWKRLEHGAFRWPPISDGMMRLLPAQGLDIKRAVLAFWVGYAATELMPLYLRLRELINSSLAPPRSRSTRPWCRCSIPAAAAPRRDTSGRSPVTTNPGAGAIRPPSPTATRQLAAQSTPSSCSRTTAVSCNATDMRPTRTSPMQLAARRSAERSPRLAA
jgi:transposase